MRGPVREGQGKEARLATITHPKDRGATQRREFQGKGAKIGHSPVRRSGHAEEKEDKESFGAKQ